MFQRKGRGRYFWVTVTERGLMQPRTAFGIEVTYIILSVHPRRHFYDCVWPLGNIDLKLEFTFVDLNCPPKLKNICIYCLIFVALIGNIYE